MSDKKKQVLAFDFGGGSGRAILGTLENGKIHMEEVHRFSNDPVIVNGTMYWDTLRHFFEIKQGIVKAKQKGGFESIGIDTWGVDSITFSFFPRPIAHPHRPDFGSSAHEQHSAINADPELRFLAEDVSLWAVASSRPLARSDQRGAPLRYIASMRRSGPIRYVIGTPSIP